ncbi:unnamed protein product, partial [Nesidiocoris tenuis]
MGKCATRGSDPFYQKFLPRHPLEGLPGRGARAFSRRALRRLRFQCERRSGLVRLCRVSTSRPAMFRVFALVALAGVFAVADESPSCPAKCMCFRSTVRCMHLHLQTIPDAPTNTSVL